MSTVKVTNKNSPHYQLFQDGLLIFAANLELFSRREKRRIRRRTISVDARYDRHSSAALTVAQSLTPRPLLWCILSGLVSAQTSK